MRLLLLAVGCALAPQLGCDDGDAPSEAPPAGLPHCGSLEAVAERFGNTIAGPYLDATLADFRFRAVDANDGSIRVVIDPPLHGGCYDTIVDRLEATCAFCAGGTSVENCLLEAEAVFRTPSAQCVACGDGRCGTGEDPTSCPADCRCGDGHCEVALGELPSSCPQDCPTACGNGVCEQLGGEVCACPEGVADCVPCARDCCVVVCGDGVCDAEGGESLASCEQDCGLGVCGDGRCLGGEWGGACEADCAAQPHNCSTCPSCFASSFGGQPVVCGDGVCTACEPLTCRTDCLGLDFGVCTVAPDGTRDCPARHCGDGVCEGDENTLICPADCVVVEARENSCQSATCDAADEARLVAGAPCEDAPLCPSHCGDGYCQGSEVPTSVNAWDDPCAQDCGWRSCAGKVDYLAYCGAAVAGEGPRCDTFELAPGNFVAAVVDCARPCPVVDTCAFLCDDAGGTPRCDVCPVPLPPGAVPCHPQSEWTCFNDETGASVRGCLPHQPELADNGACYVVSTLERCPNGCDPHRAECKP